VAVAVAVAVAVLAREVVVAAVAAVVVAAEPAREVVAAAVAVLAVAVLAAGVVPAAGAEAADRLDDGASGRPGAFGGPAATGTIAPCRRARRRTMIAA